MSFRKRVNRNWKRIGSAASVMGSLTWLLWPSDHWKADIKALVALAGSFCSWIFFELLKDDPIERPVPPLVNTPDKTQPHSHDVALLKSFNDTLSMRDRAYLRNHDFRTPTAGPRLDGLEEIADGWRGADFEFHDDAVQTAFSALQRRAAELLEMTGRYLFTDHNKPDFMSPLTDMDRTHGVRPETYRHIEEMNKKARELKSALDHFVRFSRERLTA